MKRLISILLLLMMINVAVAAQSPQVVVRLFWGDGCPHCEALKEFMPSLLEKYPSVKLYSNEIYKNETNRELFREVAKACNTEAKGVPTVFIGDKVIVGYNSYSDNGIKIEKAIQHCLEIGGCEDPLDKLGQCDNAKENKSIEVPIFGRVDSSEISLPAFTIVLGALDGFNPCAFFVLLFLLSMLIHAKSRARMLLIGGTFVFFSGLIYFLFMAAWLNIFIVIGSFGLITTIAGIIAIFIALINVKEFFFFKKGISLTIPQWAKPKLFARMREMIKAESLWTMLLATAVLAVSANAYELLCTAGFPMIFTRILTLHGLSKFSYYMYLILYNLVYIVPLLVIVLLVTVTLGAKKLSEAQGEALKLTSGLMMLGLGILLIFMPKLLNNLFAALGMIAGAILLSALMIVAKKALGGRK